MKYSQLFALLALPLKLLTLYFGYVALRWAFAPREHWPEAAPKTRFAIVIAARNEEAVIGRLVKSLLAQDYPRGLFEVFVVPNNCTDDTAGEAFRAGAQLLHCPWPVTNKGDALRQAFCLLEGKDYDAFLVFDADNVVDQQYLRRTNDAFCAGAQMVKGRQMALNPREGWVAGCYDLYFGLFDLFFNRPRARGDLSVKLVGTGFAFHRSVLEQLGGWNTRSIAEDAEFAALCARENIRVCWAPEAITWDEEPCSFSVSLRQRKRWCSGVIQVGRQMLSRLFSGAKSRRNWDFICFLVTAQLQPVSTLLLLCSWLCLAAEGGLSLTVILAGAGGYWLGCTALAAFLLLTQRSKERRNWRAAALFPVFMASWLPLQVLAMFHKTTKWREIRHGSSRLA